MDWKVAGPLMEDGRMPNLARLVKGGVRADLRSLPREELVGSPWVCIATGRVLRAADALPAFSAEGTRIPGVRTWGGRPVWDLIGEKGLTAGIVNWPRTYPASELNGWIVTNGVALAPEDGWDPILNITWPEALADEIVPLRRPATTTTDDAIGGLLNGEAWKSDTDEDIVARVQEVRRIWAEDETVVRVAAHFLDSRGQPDLTAVHFEGLLRSCHPFWGPMDPASADYADRDEIVQVFRDVVPRYYERVDVMIGEILAHTGEDATVIVCSAFGFRGPQHTPEGLLKLGSWMHSETGVLVAAGPGIRKQTSASDVSVLDIAPTVLALLGVPVPRDMDGFVATDILDSGFLDRHPVTYVDAPGVRGVVDPAQQ